MYTKGTYKFDERVVRMHLRIEVTHSHIHSHTVVHTLIQHSTIMCADGVSQKVVFRKHQFFVGKARQTT
jgi:hypothetical protein